jgi:hypothetical protein
LAAVSGITGGGGVRFGPKAGGPRSRKAESRNAAQAAARFAEVSRARADAVRESMSWLGLSVRFSIEQPGGIVRILVVDRTSGQVVRAIPLEYFGRSGGTATGTTGAILDDNA